MFLAVAVVAAISLSEWGGLKENINNFGTLPTDDVAISTLLAGLVFAGAGGANNLVQSNWIREKGFGMGAYIPRIESPITGQPEAAPTTGSMVRQDEENIKRFKGWFKVANKEQLVSFWAICVCSIIIFSVLAYATVYGKNISEEADFAFIQGEGEVLKDVVAPWFGTFFWIFGSISLILVALGVVDYVARLVVRRAQDAAPARQRELERVQDLRVHRVDDVPAGRRRAGERVRPAAGAARAERLPERHRDVHLLDPADQAQPRRPAARDPRPRRPPRRADASRSRSTASSPAGT